MQKLRDWFGPVMPAMASRVRRTRNRILYYQDRLSVERLKYTALQGTDYQTRTDLVARLQLIHYSVRCAHRQTEMAEIIRTIFAIPSQRPGCIVEAGCFMGGSTAKLSLAAKAVGRKLVVFDSFEGLPPHDERHGLTIFGERTGFIPGLYKGRIEEVRQNVRRYGELSVCEFMPGWFERTMPSFDLRVAAGFLDVDLAASTRTCLRYLYPLLVPGGVLYSHDGHLPLCIEVFRDGALWREIGGPAPQIDGLGTRKLIAIRKPLNRRRK